MGTRATIKLQDGDEIYYVYRGHDGFPGTVLRDIEAAVNKANRRWSGGEIGTFTTLFLAMHFNEEVSRLPDYELTSSFHGDESYRYHVTWDGKKYTFGVIQ